MALQEELEIQGNFLFKRRSWLPIIVYVPLLYLFLEPFIEGEQRFISIDEFTIYLLICSVISFLGLAIRCFTVGYTPQGTSGRNTTGGQLADTINTTGIYSIIRHPLYLGNYIMWLGVVCVLLTIEIDNVWFIFIFSLVYWIYYERIMFAEEQFLRNKFGERYLDWANRTSCFFTMKLRKYVQPTMPYSYKKVMKKEKDGFCLIAITFMKFHILYQLLTQSAITNYSFIIFGVVCFIIYAILRILKYKSNLLNEDGR